LARALQKGTHVAKKNSATPPKQKTKTLKLPAPRGVFLSMNSNSKKLLALSAIVLGGVLSSGYATTASTHADVAKAVSFEAPVVAKMVSPTGLSRRHEGATVTLRMTVNDKGQPSNIQVNGVDAQLKQSLVSAVSQWEFTPAKKNGVAVPTRIELPVELVEGRS
jgi:TonB family protein